jgi:hypothetical protein
VIRNVKTQEILRDLEFNNGVFPRKAIEEAIARPEQITPELLKVLDHAAQNVQKLVDQESYMAHLYAMYLLAQFRERRAYPLIVRFFSIPGEVTLDLTGDVVTEDLGRILASVSDGEIDLMASLVENEQANEYVRDASLDGLVTLVARGVRSRDEIIAYFQSLYQGKLAREYSFIWDGLVHASTELYPGEVLEDIKRAFQDDLVNEAFIGFDSVESALALGKEKVLEHLREDKRHTFIDDTISEMEWWASFDPPPPREVARKSMKVGRNEPCPCGSGKKYKRCCGAKSR